MIRNAIGFFMMEATPGALLPGFHIPSWDEVVVLQNNLGGPYAAGGHMKEAGLDHWLTPNTGADNSSGFNGLGCGLRNEGTFANLHWFFAMAYYYAPYGRIQVCGMQYNTASLVGIGLDPTGGMSVRMLKDDSDDPGTITDIDGNTYPTTKVGDQVWMASNLSAEHFSNGISIPRVTDSTRWCALTTPGMCYFNNDIANKSIYGALYNRATITYGLAA